MSTSRRGPLKNSISETEQQLEVPSICCLVCYREQVSNGAGGLPRLFLRYHVRNRALSIPAYDRSYSSRITRLRRRGGRTFPSFLSSCVYARARLN